MTREKAIEAALEDIPHQTEFFQRAARCSLAEAVVVLMRLRDRGVAATDRGFGGMTWYRATASTRQHPLQEDR